MCKCVIKILDILLSGNELESVPVPVFAWDNCLLAPSPASKRKVVPSILSAVDDALRLVEMFPQPVPRKVMLNEFWFWLCFWF